jgi:tetratricopeptide (TPR) repeat protein
MTIDGGGVAAFGFRYQFLVTAEEILLALIAHSGDLFDLTLIVEPTKRELGDTADDDVVDFAIERNGTVFHRVQVKSSRNPSKMNPLRYSDAASIFKRMGNDGDDAVVLTNKPLAKKLRKACANPSTSSRGQHVYSVTGNTITAGEQRTAKSVVHDERSPADIKLAVLSLIREMRSDRALGQGEKSAALLAALLLDTIFESGADLSPRRLSGQTIIDLLGTPDVQIAHALRRFDWGVSLLEVPRLVSAVARAAELGELTGLFTEGVTGRNPRVAVLMGVTGFGKSTIAADFCHLNRHFYEFVTWIDCRTDTLIEAKIKDTLTRLGADPEAVDDVATAFRTEIARLGGPFVLVFDGARRRQDIEKYIPPSGCGFVIVTTTNSTGWWSTASEVHVDPLTDDEAIACFEAYARLEPGVHTATVSEIVNRLERVPLAIAMAALYFRNSDEDITLLSRAYFESLDALDESTAIPEGFDRTAFAAIQFSVSQIGRGGNLSEEDRRQTQALIYHSAFFAPELIPLNLLLQTVDETVTIDLTNPPSPAMADQSRRNGVLVNLRTQTLARRRNYADASGELNPASDTINFHPLVHEILRAIHRKLAPADRLLDLLILLMNCTHGWIKDLRRDGKFFPVEQLLAHGQWILDLVDTITPPVDVDPQHVYVFRCAKLYLRCEIANCYASRGEYRRSVDMIEQALDEIDGVTLTVRAQLRAAEAACDSLTDAIIDRQESATVTRLANRAITELTKFDAIGDPHRGDVIVAMAIQAARSINSSEFAADMQALVDQLGAIATRQQVSAAPEAMVLDQIQQLLASGRSTQALAQIRQARGSNPSIYERVMFDSLEAIALLRLDRFTPAADAIDRILTAGRGAQMRTHLQLACTSVGAALRETQESWAGRSSRLQRQQSELRALLESLTG